MEPTARYETRNHALVPAQTLVLAGEELIVEVRGCAPQRIPLAEIAELRLAHVPTRAELERYRCALRARGGAKLAFFNRTYRGALDVVDTSAEYAAFVRALHTAILRAAPRCRFLAGVPNAPYAFNVGCAVLGLAGFATGIALVLFLAGLHWLAAALLALAVVMVPATLRWLALNREPPYDPRAIPPQLLPGAAPR